MLGFSLAKLYLTSYNEFNRFTTGPEDASSVSVLFQTLLAILTGNLGKFRTLTSATQLSAASK